MGRILRRLALAGVAALIVGLIAAPGAGAQAAVSCLSLATFETLEPTILGTDGNDVLRGTSESDLIAGLDGNDVLIGNVGSDLLLGGRGDDAFHGDAPAPGGPPESGEVDICIGQQGEDVAVPDTCEKELGIEGDFVEPPAEEG